MPKLSTGSLETNQKGFEKAIRKLLSSTAEFRIKYGILVIDKKTLKKLKKYASKNSVLCN